ncbi:hydroxysqualene dehydroxylase [Roseicella aquatilis]|uniref:hydroxysqualene dehydroxylase n=1 Tax=Roseicella aquatilis TaxID=2527868 RepID=UPI00197EDF4B|nr:FAD-dependent oxidoreductase [Roseicella aquatilis]
MAQRVVILGGGVAGLSAAHELLERGFEVEVFEKMPIPGGKARSIPVLEGLGNHDDKADEIKDLQATMAQDPAARSRLWLPGEHGFRFFPNFYRHITDTLARIPTATGTVFDHLVETSEVLVASYDKRGVVLPSRFPESLAEVATALRAFLWSISPRNDIPYAEIEYFATCVWRILTSCEPRRLAEYEKIGWWEFVGAEEHSVAYQRLLAIGITRSLVAAKAREASTKTIGDIFVQLLLGIVAPGTAPDRLLDGPTNDVWIAPWLDHLRRQGLRYHLEAEVVRIHLSGGRVNGVTVRQGGRERIVTGDWFIGALPVERMAPLVTPAMVAIEPALGHLAELATHVQWMNGIQFYLRRDVPIAHGHVIFVDSPWALTAVSQRQFWRAIDFSAWGDGHTEGILSVDISQWDTPGLNGRAAIDCTRQEIAEECWAQLKRSLNVEGRVLLRDEDLHFWFLDPDIVDDPANPKRRTNVEPLLVNNVDTWRLRPEAATAIPNFMLASDYVRTWTDLATMEGANEAARRAVNAILDRGGSKLPRCQVWDLHEPPALAPLRAYDQARYEAGLPWDERLPRAVEAALVLGQGMAGISTGGAGPLAAITPLGEAAEAPGSPLADPLVLRALSLIGTPDGLYEAMGHRLPGLGAPPPGIELASAAAGLLGTLSAGGGPARRRVRVTQKA